MRYVRPSLVSAEPTSRTNKKKITISPVVTYYQPKALHRKGLLPTEDELLSPRDSLKSFLTFCSFFLPCTVGKVEYNQRAPCITISEFVTISDEAYTLIVIENSYKRWKAEAEDENKENKQGWPLPLWTSDPQAATLFNGWKREGIDKYRNLMFELNTRRRTPDQEKLEVRLVKQLRRLAKGKRKKRSTGIAAPQIEIEECPIFEDPVPREVAIEIDDSSDDDTDD